LNEDICVTGIKELDESIGGGFDRGSLVLLEGKPGVGKSIFASKFIYYGACKFNEKGLYVSFTVSKKVFYRHMASLDMDFVSLEEKGLFKFLDLPTVVDKNALKSIFNSIIESLVEFNAQRFVIDPITPLVSILDPIELRATLHNLLKRYIEEFDVTALLIANTNSHEDREIHSIVEFIADVVLRMHLIRDNNNVIRQIEIVKFRGRRIRRHFIQFSI